MTREQAVADERSFGDALRTARRGAGWTQEELADRTGLSARGISDLERGVRRIPHRDTAERLADALGLATDVRQWFLDLGRSDAQPSGSDRDVTAAGGQLPTPLTSFLGRETEITAVAELLRQTGVRLVTLTGTGGTGKTRLALQVATTIQAEFADGARFVPLAPIMDPALVLTTIGRTFGLQRLGGRPVGQVLSDQTALLVLDNFEHLLPAARDLSQLLRDCPNLTVLVTSRAPLGLQGEFVFPLMPLPVPDPAITLDLSALADSPAIQLFIERARAVLPGFEPIPDDLAVIANICARLDGLPLAIELAAARTRLISPGAMIIRLDRRLSLLAHGAVDAPERHQTMRAAIGWSYDLLDRDSQALFRRLAAYAGTFSLEAVCGWLRDAGIPADTYEALDRIAPLVDRSLVLRLDSEDVEPRFWLLETLREFGLEKLEEAHETTSAQDGQLRCVEALVATAEVELLGADQVSWFHRLELDHANIRMALAWALESNPPTATRIAGGLIRFWDHHSHHGDGRQWLELVLAADDAADDAQRAKLWWGVGVLALLEGNYPVAGPAFEASLAHAETVDDHYHAGFALNGLGSLQHHLGNHARATELHALGLAHISQTGDMDGIAALQGNLAYGQYLTGDLDGAVAQGEASLELYRQLVSEHGMASTLGNLGAALLAQGSLDRSREVLMEGLDLGQHIGNKWYILLGLEGLAGVATELGERRRAVQLYAAVAALRATSNIAFPPHDLERNQKYLDACVARLSATEYDADWQSGSELSVERAIDLARMVGVND